MDEQEKNVTVPEEEDKDHAVLGEELNTKVTHEYSDSDIQVLDGLEAVRKRPGMYIASTSAKGLHHLVWEIVDNGIDEAMAGYADTIRVTVDKDNIITVEDNGRGMPRPESPRSRRSSRCCMRAASSAAERIRCPAVCMVSVLRSSMH